MTAFRPDWGFPQSSVGKESDYSTRDMGLIPGSGRSPGEGIGNPLPWWLRQIKRLPAMRETRVRSLGWEDPLEKEMAPHSSTVA